MPQSPDNTMFSMLPERRAPWKEFIFSMGTESVLGVLLAWVGVSFGSDNPTQARPSGDCAGPDAYPSQSSAGAAASH